MKKKRRTTNIKTITRATTIKTSAKALSTTSTSIPMNSALRTRPSKLKEKEQKRLNHK